MTSNIKLKKCKKKIYEIWMCRPPLGTCVINKLEQAAVVQQCKGRTYFTASEMTRFKTSNPSMYNFLCKNADITNEKRPFVLCGTMGEMWAVNANSLARTYIFASDDSEITSESLQKRAGTSKGILDWTKIKTRADSAECYAQFIPLPKTGQVQTAWGSILTVNDPRVKVHGKGDFILYEMLPNGQPNNKDKRVVNGAVFKNTYNNIGWVDCLSSDNYEMVIDSSKFPKLCPSSKDNSSDNNINNPQNYKPCRKKQVEYWMCIPPEGTVILNKFENTDLITYFKQHFPKLAKNCFLTAKELNDLKASNAQAYNFIINKCPITDSNNNVVLCGTEGELLVTSYQDACNNYLTYSDNSVVEISSIIKEKVVNWFKVRNKDTSTELFACFVPLKEKGSINTNKGKTVKYNHDGIPHGKGDFIVCTGTGSKPNLEDRWVENGLIFSNTYDNRGWSDCITLARTSIINPPALFDNSKLDGLKNKEYLLKWYQSHGLDDFYNLVMENKFNADILNNLVFMTKLSDYLVSKHKFEILECNCENCESIDDLQYAFIYLRRDDSSVNVYYYNNLCGWTLAEDSKYYEEPFEVSVSTKAGVDEFITLLLGNMGTYDLILDIFTKIPKSDDFISKLKSLGDTEKASLNKYTFNYDRLKLYLAGVVMLYNQYNTNKKIWVNSEDDYMEICFYEKQNDDLISFDLFTTAQIIAYASPTKGDTMVDVEVNIISKFDFKKFMDILYNGSKEDESYKVKGYEVGHAKVFTKDGSLVYFQCQSDKIYCNNSDLEVHIRSLTRNPLIEKQLDWDATIQNDCVEVEPIQFYKIVTSYMDKFVKYNKYHNTEAIGTSNNSPLGVLKVLGSNKVGRYFCELEYTFGNMYINISNSTLDMIRCIVPSMVKDSSSKTLPEVSFESMHYFQVMLRLGLHANAFDFKNLKRQFIKYNKEVFDNRISNTMVCCVGNYGARMESIDDCVAYQNGVYNCLAFNARQVNCQNSELSQYAKRTLLHEMSHAYIEAVYGTCQEAEGEDGNSVYGLSPLLYGVQIWFHGKKFGNVIEMVADKTGFSFNDLFGYGFGDKAIKDKNGSDTRCLSAKNAYDFGQIYRKFPIKGLSYSSFCVKHNKIGCSCDSENKVDITSGRYLGLCKKCGKLHFYDDESIALISEDSIDYLDVVDRVGIVALTKCECGGSLSVITPDADKEALQTYLADLDYSNRYVNHMLELCENNKAKYENYFKQYYGCSLELSRGKMPCLSIKITNNAGFSECYKLFISCSITKKLVGKLYKDYGIDYKGSYLHTFRISTDKSVLSFFEYVMSFIRNNLKES